ncbi:MAG: hypothetical protein AAB853_00935, partial [Patescibacteria group bacterium]
MYRNVSWFDERFTHVVASKKGSYRRQRRCDSPLGRKRAPGLSSSPEVLYGPVGAEAVPAGRLPGRI